MGVVLVVHELLVDGGEHSWQLFEEDDEEWHFSPQVGE
jgi:hypothetical protein